MELENIILSEISQVLKANITCFHSYVESKYKFIIMKMGDKCKREILCGSGISGKEWERQ
jgi:hypothetical protein